MAGRALRKSQGHYVGPGLPAFGACALPDGQPWRPSCDHGTGSCPIQNLVDMPWSAGPWSGCCPAGLGTPHFPLERAAWEADKMPRPRLRRHLTAGRWCSSVLPQRLVISSWQTPGTVFNPRLSGMGGAQLFLSQRGGGGLCSACARELTSPGTAVQAAVAPRAWILLGLGSVV